MSTPTVTVRVDEDTLFAAMSELHNSGYVEWIAEDGTCVRLVGRAEPSTGTEPAPSAVPAVPAAPKAAEAAEAADGGEQMYGVMWSADFDARTPQEAAQLAYEQLQDYGGPDSLPPVLEVQDEDGVLTVIDLSEGAEG